MIKKPAQQNPRQRGQAATPTFARCTPDLQAGLSAEQVGQRIEAGAVNAQAAGLTPSVPRIVAKNILTPFNLISIALAVIIILVGHIDNTLFLLIAFWNTAMGIFQEIRAKRTLDKLSVLSQAKVQAVRDGNTIQLAQDSIVLDDIVYLSTGDQVCADGVVVRSVGLEADESLLTGESDRIRKQAGDRVLSGSFVTGGHAWVHTTAVGGDNYANALTAEAKIGKRGKQRHKSKLLQILNNIIRILTVVIIPLGLLLFFANYNRGETLDDSVLGAAAAMVGMIPSGLVLLTGITLTVGALNLARRKALVQSLPSIETLARVDVLCLDKTGTITDGALVFERMELQEGAEEEACRQAVAELMGALQDANATAKILRQTFGESGNWSLTAAIPFSSDRKWSGATFGERGSYLLGAPGILFGGGPSPLSQQVNSLAAQGFRVLCLAHSSHPLAGEQPPRELRCLALFLLTDSIRENAVETFRYFAEEGVTLKVISGDNPRTTAAVAKKAGLAGADKACDMSAVGDHDDLTTLVDTYTVFGHVSPQQKRELIRALQQNGHTTCMTGDGVNDILAMRESDCSVAMVGGSGAARSACDFVLMSSNFGAMKGVLREGRRVINNIERVASLFLVNTIYSVILSLFYTFLPFPYPLVPIQMTPINALTVGIPAFFLALQSNYDRPGGRLLSNIFEHSFPAALTIVFNTLYLQMVGIAFDLSQEEISTMVAFLLGVVGFFLLVRISRPHTRRIKMMLWTLIAAFVLIFAFLGGYFSLGNLLTRNVFFYLPLMYFSFYVHGFLGKISRRLTRAIRRFRHRQQQDILE